MPIQWQDVVTDAITLRRELHKNPELGWQETRTAERIRTILSNLNIPWRRCADTGTVAWLNQHGKGRHIALRGDIDALPITEKTALDWASGTTG